MHGRIAVHNSSSSGSSSRSVCRMQQCQRAPAAANHTLKVHTSNWSLCFWFPADQELLSAARHGQGGNGAGMGPHTAAVHQVSSRQQQANSCYSQMFRSCIIIAKKAVLQEQARLGCSCMLVAVRVFWLEAAAYLGQPVCAHRMCAAYKNSF
jgi:hypothetical protein